MLGAIAGDIIGSVYEGNPIKTKDFPLFSPLSTFTDDSVLTIAVARAIVAKISYQDAIRELGHKYPHAGYGGTFIGWLFSSRPMPYNSWGNGSAMRVSPIGHAFGQENSVLEEAKKSAEITHDHPEGIKGAQAAALAVFLARKGTEKKAIGDCIEQRFGYDLSRTTDEIRPPYSFDISCQGTVPPALRAFLDSTSFEDAVRNAVSLGGDSDTLACITGGVAEAFYKDMPLNVLRQVRERLTPELWSWACQFYFLHGIPNIIQKLKTL